MRASWFRPMSDPNDLTHLERELEQLKQQLPRHSVPVSLLLRIEELEEEIAARKKRADDQARLDSPKP